MCAEEPGWGGVGFYARWWSFTGVNGMNGGVPAGDQGNWDSCTHRYLRTKGPWSLGGGGEQSNSSRERGEVRGEMKQGRGNERLSA